MKRRKQKKVTRVLSVTGASNARGDMLRARRQERGLKPAEQGLEAEKVFLWCAENLPGTVFDVLACMFRETVAPVEQMDGGSPAKDYPLPQYEGGADGQVAE